MSGLMNNVGLKEFALSLMSNGAFSEYRLQKNISVVLSGDNMFETFI